MWIGLTDAEEESVFRWVNGDVLQYEHWNVGETYKEPNGRHYENCVSATSKMFDTGCEHTRHRTLCSTVGG